MTKSDKRQDITFSSLRHLDNDKWRFFFFLHAYCLEELWHDYRLKNSTLNIKKHKWYFYVYTS